MAALLLLAARIIAILAPSDMSTEERPERLATRIVNLTL